MADKRAAVFMEVVLRELKAAITSAKEGSLSRESPCRFEGLP
jgi:hypothetical protein